MALLGSSSNFLNSPLNIDYYYSDPFVVSVDNNDILFTDYQGTYQWTDCGLSMPISGETNSTFSPLAYNSNGGLFSLTITNGTCVETSECFDFQTFGLAPIYNPNIEISPNPVNDQLKVKGAGQLDYLEIRDANGRLVLVLGESVNEEYKINVSDWKSGVYFISSSDEIGAFTKRFVKI
jgi:hypothetical protein